MGEPETLERRVVSVLFADLVGFTSLAERLDAEDLAGIQDAYFAAVRETVARHGGAIEKFIGDAAMAVFGLERTRDDDAERAIRTGLGLVGAVDRLGAQLQLDGHDLRVRVGIESGEVVVASGGADQGRVTGDVVNTAARLQAAAAPGGVLLGEGAILAAAAVVELGAPQVLALKGKSEPSRAAEALGLRAEPRRDAAMGALRAPTIGREAELEELATALRRASGGASLMVVVLAPPGTGKSRLLAEFLAGTGALAWRARVRADGGASMEPIAELARAATAAASAAPSSTAVSSARARVLEASLAELTNPGTGATRRDDRDERFATWIDGLDMLAGPGPVVWAVEDIHWASGDVLAFLAAAARAPSHGGRLIVATARPGVSDRLDAIAERVDLQPLPPTDAGRLVTALVGDALPAELVTSIEHRSDGNPLFIEELLRSWVATGTLEVTDGGYRLTRPPAEVGLPSTVQAIYAGQLDDLPPPARDVARRASVAGRRFPVDALGDLDVATPEIGIAALLERALVSGPVPDEVTGPGFVYRHALLRDAAYNSLGRADRARLHVRLARWLEAIAGPDRGDSLAEWIGGHYEAAVAVAPMLAAGIDIDVTRPQAAGAAAAWLERAAVHALSLGARDAAVGLLRRSLALTTPEDGEDAGRRMVSLATTLAASGDMDEGLRWAERGETIARSSFLATASGPAARGEARASYANATDVRAEIEAEQLHFLDARAIAEHTLSDLGDVRDVPWARLQLRVARAKALWDDTYDVAAVDDVLTIARRAGDMLLELEALWSLAAFSDDTAAEAEARLAELADLAIAQGQWQYVAYARRAQGISVAFDGGDPWPLLDESVEVAAAHGLREHLAWAEYSRSEVGLMLGEWDLAEAAARRAIDLAEANGYVRVAVRTWFALAPIASARGDRAALEHAGRYFAEHAADFPDSPYGRLMHRALDELFSRAGLVEPTDVAIDHLATSFEQDIDGATASEAAWLVITAWLDGGRAHDVRAAIARIRAGFLTLPTSDLIRGVVEIFEARARIEDGMDDPLEPLRTGLLLLREMRATWWIRRALRLLEEVGAATPDELDEAAAIEARLGVVDPTL